MKTIKILILIIVCLIVNSISNAQTLSDIKTYNVNVSWKDNSDESKLISTLNAEVVSVGTDIYKYIPKEGCLMITNWEEYNLICKKPQVSSIVFNNHNLFLMFVASSGCELPTAKVGLYSNGNISVFIKLESTYRNMQYIIVSFLIPKKYCNGITNISEIHKKINEPIPL